ncbi:MAG: hypothetical protein GY719_41115 [bacterium]|nr:hypothetical protein [bacterium]
MRRRSAAASLIVLLAGAAACDRSAPAPSVDPAVYSEARDLAAELPLAEIHRETHRIDFGDAGSRRHLLEGWGADEIDGLDATTFAWGLGVSSLVEFTVLEPRNLKVVGRCRAFRWQDAQRQTVTVEVNGRRIRDLRLEGKMTEIRFTLPAEDLARGRNRLRFLYSYHGSPSRVIPGSADSRQLAVAWDFLRFGTERDELTLVAGAEGLFVPAGSEMRTYFRLDGPGYLLIDGLERGGRGRRLRVSVRVDGGVEGSEWVIEVPSGPTAIDLGNPPVSLVEIRLTALPARSGSGDPSGVLVRAPELRSRPTPTDAPVPATEAAPPGRPHVIVYLP